MTLTNRDIVELTAWRRKLHQHPEISNEEEKTASEVVDFLADTGPDKVLTGLGGHGVAAVYESGKAGADGPVPLRTRCAADLRAVRRFPCSLVPGKSHMCGHDGHTAILAALGRQFGRERPARGRVVLMFQPAEETGNGAAGVVADPRFGEIAPGFRLLAAQSAGRAVRRGAAQGRRGQLCFARHAHRAGGQDRACVHARNRRLADAGGQPADAGADSARRRNFCRRRFRHGHRHPCPDGRAVFGIAPGHAEVWATLRTRRDERMADLCAAARRAGREDRGRAWPFRPLRLSRDLRCQRQRAGRRGASAARARRGRRAAHARKPCRCAPRKISASSATSQVGDVLPRRRRALPGAAQSRL